VDAQADRRATPSGCSARGSSRTASTTCSTARGARKTIDDVEKDSQTITIARERACWPASPKEIDRLIAAARASAAY
jgi:hypothetical protein